VQLGPYGPGAKRDHLRAAKELVQARDLPSLRYACLELRFCIEALCYDVLPHYEAELPFDAVGKWQPRKVVEALLDVDPDSDDPPPSHRETSELGLRGSP
jgi:hypothetical protein